MNYTTLEWEKSEHWRYPGVFLVQFDECHKTSADVKNNGANDNIFHTEPPIVH